MTLMEYLIKTGSERVAQQCRENIYAVQTLKDFQYIDRDGKDQVHKHTQAHKALIEFNRLMSEVLHYGMQAHFVKHAACGLFKDNVQWVSDLLCKHTKPTIKVFMGCW